MRRLKISLEKAIKDLDLSLNTFGFTPMRVSRSSKISKERVSFRSTPVVYILDITTKPISRTITILAIRNNSTNLFPVCKILQTGTIQSVNIICLILCSQCSCGKRKKKDGDLTLHAFTHYTNITESMLRKLIVG